jgi:hypothetical protein
VRRPAFFRIQVTGAWIEHRDDIVTGFERRESRPNLVRVENFVRQSVRGGALQRSGNH